MSDVDSFVGEIRMFGGNYAPRGWFFCAGQYLSVAQYQLLYAVIYNVYGGNGQTEFRLPDLRGIAPTHCGNSTGPGLSPHYLGQYGGNYEKFITYNSMPSHSHSLRVENTQATTATPGEAMVPAKAYRNSGPPRSRDKDMYCDPDPGALANLSPSAVSVTGKSDGHPIYMDNYQPFQTCSFIICWDGEYPPHS